MTMGPYPLPLPQVIEELEEVAKDVKLELFEPTGKRPVSASHRNGTASAATPQAASAQPAPPPAAGCCSVQ